MKEFLDYVERSTEQVVQNSQGELVKKVHEKVEAIRNDKKSEVEFMTDVERLKEEGIKEGQTAIAVAMLKEGISIETIIKITGFSKEKIEELKKNMHL